MEKLQDCEIKDSDSKCDGDKSGGDSGSDSGSDSDDEQLYVVKKWRGTRDRMSTCDFNEEFDTLEEAMEYYNTIDLGGRCCMKEILHYNGSFEIEERIGDNVECEYEPGFDDSSDNDPRTTE